MEFRFYCIPHFIGVHYLKIEIDRLISIREWHCEMLNAFAVAARYQQRY